MKSCTIKLREYCHRNMSDIGKTLNQVAMALTSIFSVTRRMIDDVQRQLLFDYTGCRES